MSGGSSKKDAFEAMKMGSWNRAGEFDVRQMIITREVDQGDIYTFSAVQTLDHLCWSHALLQLLRVKLYSLEWLARELREQSAKVLFRPTGKRRDSWINWMRE